MQCCICWCIRVVVFVRVLHGVFAGTRVLFEVAVHTGCVSCAVFHESTHDFVTIINAVLLMWFCCLCTRYMGIQGRRGFTVCTCRSSPCFSYPCCPGGAGPPLCRVAYVGRRIIWCHCKYWLCTGVFLFWCVVCIPPFFPLL